MVHRIYDPVKDAGADDKARAAATAVAEHGNRQIKVEADLNLLKWMIGANIALTISVVARTFFA